MTYQLQKTWRMSTIFDPCMRTCAKKTVESMKDVEGATFVPLVFSTAGGMGRSSSVTFKRIAALLAEKTGLSYAATSCRLSFALLRSAITALRGSRRRAPTSTSFQPALALAEARVPH